MEAHLRVLLQERLHSFGFVGRKIVQHDMNFSRPAGSFQQILEKSQELGAGVPCCRLAFYLPRLYLQRGIQREPAVTVILEAVAFCPARRQRRLLLPLSNLLAEKKRQVRSAIRPSD